MPQMVIKSEERRLVYGEVYAPLQIDTDGEAMTAKEIEAMAHRFLSLGRTSKIDVQHNCVESGALVVESFIARKNDPDGFVLGSWVLGAVIPEEYWGAVKKGELNGFSFMGPVAKSKTRAEVTVTKRMLGETEKVLAGGILPSHDHSIDVAFDDNGSVVRGVTGDTLGHFHPVTKTTATEVAMDHSHRLILIENE
jgi:hypothetical protein